MKIQDYHYEGKGILAGRGQLGSFPMERLKRVGQPTTKITNDIQRFDLRENGFARAARGDFGPIAQKEFPHFSRDYPTTLALYNMIDHLAPMVDGEVAPSKAPITEEPGVLSQHIKSFGYHLGSDIVGICQLPRWAVYSHDLFGNPIKLEHKNAIVIVVDQGYKTLHGSTGYDWISSTNTFGSYAAVAFISSIMANYIRRLGYPARAHHLPTEKYQVAIVPLLLLAGIGELCRAGIVLNPFLGFRSKVAVVTTDLPLEPDKPIDFGLQEFCHICNKCARECPANAISMGDKVMHNGYETWKLDVERCTTFRVTNPNGSGCGRCVKVCPWNKPEGWIHDLVRLTIKHTPFMDKFIVKMDDVFGYGKQDERDKWWFDLEVVDGVLGIPRSSGKQK